MKIETQRLTITEFDMSMAESVHKESLDEDNHRFVPDEVFETVEEASETLEFLIDVYEHGNGPLVYPVTLKDGTYIGYVQAVPFDDGTWEVGYHIGESYTKQGYATEAVTAFLPVIMKQIGITEIKGICLADNKASAKVMERCGFIKLSQGMGNYQGEDREICKFVYYLSPKDIVVKFFEDGYTKQNFDFVMTCMAENYIDHSPASARSNADAVGILKIVADQFSNLKVSVLDVFAEGSMVATRILYDGVHTGTCMGIPATGKHITFEALENFKVEKGKITESWGYWPDKEIEQKLKS
ncbi:MAG: GNAT family N-acetyltransferase [Oscillospiraceae bacterium]|nr:GNAT family N-acetyltransferase [Oscillospiraceae bacterium]